MYMYSMLVYGVPYTEKLQEAYRELEEDGDPYGLDTPEPQPELFGFESPYSGAGVQAGYLGVHLDDIDAVAPWRAFSDVMVEPSPADKALAQQHYDELHPHLKALLKEDGIQGPALYLIHTTS